MILKSNPILRDLVLKHIGPFLFCFFSIMFILLMQFLILHVDKLIGKGLPAGIVIELIITNLAYMVVMAVPMAVLVATLIAFGRFSEWNEWTALRAAGVHPWRLLSPVLVLTLIMSAGLMLFSNFVLPISNQKARSLFIDIRMKKPGFDLKEGAFYDGINGYTFLVKNIDSETDSLFDITLYQKESFDRYQAVIRAQKGTLTSEPGDLLTLMLYEGSIVRFLPDQNQTTARTEQSDFEQYRITFDLSELAFSRSNPDQRSQNDRTMSSSTMIAVIDSIQNQKNLEVSAFIDRSNAVISSPAPRIWSNISAIRTSGSDLAAYESQWSELTKFENPIIQNQTLNRISSNLEQYRMDLENTWTSLEQKDGRAASYLVEIHKKFSIPFACILFALIGAPIGLLTRKGNIGLAAVISSGLLTLYFVGVIQGEKLADRLFISPFWGMWGINLIYLFAALFLVWIVRQPLQAASFTHSFWNKVPGMNLFTVKWFRNKSSVDETQSLI